ncbi:MAG: MBL fold metallo-hydrolase [Paludibacteraceae bacterium]|nr:MBL fold metallo-hydrolase [Paludibacteraceae bacterium]
MKTLTVSVVSLLCCMLSCVGETRGFFSFNIETFEKKIADADVIRLDVRTAAEYAEGHLEDAINIDVKKPEFVNLATSSLSREKTIAVYCRSGKRSKLASELLVNSGYRVIELNEGYLGWVKAGKPTSKEEVDVFTTPSGVNVYFYCIKHGSLKMRVADKWIYVDPVANAIPPVTDFTAMPKADALFVTHEHFDHLDSLAIRQLTKAETQLVLNPRSSEILGGLGSVMKNGDSKMVGDKWKVEAVPAYNTTEEKKQFHPKGRDNGYLFTIGGLRIYVAGDTEDIPEMQDLKDIDIAFLPCNLPFTMSPEQLANAAKIIKPKVLFPYHYGKTDIQQVVKLLEGSGIDVRIRQYQ